MPAPKGNNNAGKAKVWTAAINRALAKRSRRDGVEAIDELAEKLLLLCDEDNLGALKEFGDRMEGKSAQSVNVTGEDDGPLVIHLKTDHADSTPK